MTSRAHDAASRVRTVVFVNRYFSPDISATSQMLTDLAFGLARRGWRVRVVTSRQRYDDPGARLPPREILDGVVVDRIPTTRFGRTSLFGRAIDYLTFYLSAAWTLLRVIREGDVVVAKTDPPLLSILTTPIVRLRRAIAVNWLQDLFPEVATGVGLGQRRLAGVAFALLQRLRDASLRAAACNVVLGERMRDLVLARAVPAERIEVVHNWADGVRITPIAPDRNPLRREWGLNGRFVVGYSGNLGRAHEFQTMLAGIAATAGAGVPVTWLFIGGGSAFVELEREVRARRLSNVVFKPYQPRERLAQSLSAADVHLVSLRPELEGLIVPSKYYGIAAAGRPTIFIGDTAGEIALIVSHADAGLTVAPEDGAALARHVLELAGDPVRAAAMGARARRDFDDRFDAERAIARWVGVIEHAARARDHRLAVSARNAR